MGRDRTATDGRDGTDYDALVYDLDGTLVRLAVDWTAAIDDARRALLDAGIDVDDAVDPSNGWALLDLARERGVGDVVHEAIAAHEREGAANSRRLPAADDLAGATVPVAVCSLNAEEACRIALNEHGLSAHVDAVVGRDTAETYKPDPGSLLAAVQALSADPRRTLFVGDSERDEETARRADVPFEYVGDGPTDY